MSENKFSFTGRFKLFAIISCIFCSIGLVGIILTFFGVPAFNFDTEFAGGVKMDMELGVPVTREIQQEIEKIYTEVAGVTANVVTSGDSGTAVMVKTVEISSELRQDIFDKVSEKFGAENVALLGTTYTSATVGNDLKVSAILSMVIACALILVYITIRFEFRSGIAAIVCLVHDVLVMLSFFVVFQIPMNMTFIAAALTIVGYSINATIVVFDRVRENYSRQGNRGDFALCVDNSIWQTMRRSIGTTITTLLPILLILFLGVTSIRIFAIPLTVGIISGCYSSIFISGPLWNVLKKSEKKA